MATPSFPALYQCVYDHVDRYPTYERVGTSAKGRAHVSLGHMQVLFGHLVFFQDM